jgi:hypothetical protein
MKTHRSTCWTRRCVLGLATSAMLVLPSVGLAQDRAGKDRVFTLDVVRITGRVQKPIAAVDVMRIEPKLLLSELRQPFLERIEKAIYRDPF